MLLAFALPISIAATNIALVLNLLLLIRRAATSKDWYRQLGGGITAPLLVYLALDLTAALFSGYPVHLRSFFEDKWVTIGYFIALGLALDSRTVERAFQALFLGGAVAAGYALVQFFSGWDVIHQKSIEACGGGFMAVGFFNHHLTYGGSALVLALIAWIWIIYPQAGFFPLRKNFLKSTPSRSALVYGVNLIEAALLLAGVFVSYARSAILGLGAGGIVLILTAPQKLKRYLILGAAAGVIIFMIFVPGLLDRFERIWQKENNESPRLLLWQTSVRIICDHPWFGVGQGNWKEAFEKFKVPGEYTSTDHPHNDILSTAVDGGLIALLGFLWIWITLYQKGWLKLRNISSPHTRRGIVAGMTVGAGILTAGLAQNYLSDAEVGSLVWFTLGLVFAQEKLPSKES